ncbi:MAG: transcriptional regulator [Candidatus Paceibacterota bacterium]
MFSLPQEIEVWYVIPAVRRELARILAEKHDMKQKDIAALLGITEAAVSQYVHNKRASEIIFSGEMKREMEISAKIIIKSSKRAVSEILRIVSLAKQQGFSCEVCKRHNRGILPLCSASPVLEVRK